VNERLFRNLFRICLSTITLLVLVILGVVYFYSPVFRLNELTARLQIFPQHAGSREAWLSAWNDWQEWRWGLAGQTATDIHSQETSITAGLTEYSHQYEDFNRGYMFDLLPLNIEVDVSAQRQVPFAQETIEDPDFVQGHSYYRVRGEAGREEYRELKLGVDGAGWTIDERVELITPPQTQIVGIGSQELASVQATISDLFTQLPSALAAGDTASLTPLVSDTPEKTLADYQVIYDSAYRLASAQVEQLQIAVDLADTDWVPVGGITLQQAEFPDCEPANLSIVYHRTEQRWAIANLATTLRELCARALPGVGTYAGRPVYQLTCTDCGLAPVGRYYTLSSTYIPAVVPTGLVGGGSLVPEAANALYRMFLEAQSLGYAPIVTSAYRSYTDQVNTFEFYVAVEQALGYDRATAEIRANTLSARPGQSEHQLGTGVDVGPSTVYPYFANNAHRFGYILSFTAPASVSTGIIYEPWHLRYVGVEHATAIYDAGYLTDGAVYLEKYLQELGDW
jgi:hypothetical protein